MQLCQLPRQIKKSSLFSGSLVQWRGRGVVVAIIKNKLYYSMLCAVKYTLLESKSVSQGRLHGGGGI